MLHLARGEDDEIHRQRARVEKVADLSDPFRRTVSALHDYQQIEIAIGGGLTVGVGTEQNDIFWTKCLYYLLSDLRQESWSN